MMYLGHLQLGLRFTAPALIANTERGHDTLELTLEDVVALSANLGETRHVQGIRVGREGREP